MYKLYINPKHKISHINPEIQGHFSEHLGRCIYEGVFVGENSDIPNTNGMRNDVVEALKNIKIPVLRWPGGCFADEYHWRDGIGPKEKRKKMINTHWGGVLEDNSFGTHEYMELIRQLGCKNYINGNVGSGTVQEMSEWVEYMTFDGVSPMADLRAENGHKEPWTVDYFGVGNENWGCGGNMTPEYYANLYRRYQTYVRTYNWEKPISKICCGANGTDFEWSDTVMDICFRSPKELHGFMDGLSLHYYTVPGTWEHKGSATDFTEQEWYTTLYKALDIEYAINAQECVMDKYDKENKVGMIVDEWGTWYDCEPGTNPGFLYQQNTMRDAMVAAINLNIFHKFTGRLKMCNIAQVVNVLQSMILTDGPRMVLTPTYYVFKMFKVHQNATYVPVSCRAASITSTSGATMESFSVSVSRDKKDVLHVSMANPYLDRAQKVELKFEELKPHSVSGEIIQAPSINAYNDFGKEAQVKTAAFRDAKVSGTSITLTLPAASVVTLEVK